MRNSENFREFRESRKFPDISGKSGNSRKLREIPEIHEISGNSGNPGDVFAMIALRQRLLKAVVNRVLMMYLVGLLRASVLFETAVWHALVMYSE